MPVNAEGLNWKVGDIEVDATRQVSVETRGGAATMSFGPLSQVAQEHAHLVQSCRSLLTIIEMQQADIRRLSGGKEGNEPLPEAPVVLTKVTYDFKGRPRGTTPEDVMAEHIARVRGDLKPPHKE